MMTAQPQHNTKCLQKRLTRTRTSKMPAYRLQLEKKRAGAKDITLDCVAVKLQS